MSQFVHFIFDEVISSDYLCRSFRQQMRRQQIKYKSIECSRMKNTNRTDKRTEKKVKKERIPNESHSIFSCTISRKYLTEIFLTEVNNIKITNTSIARISGVSLTTIHNIRNGKLPSLEILCLLFAAPFTHSILTPRQACTAVTLLIAESLPYTHHLPALHSVTVTCPVAMTGSGVNLPSSESLPTLSAYMKHLRTHYLQCSAREVCRRFDHCDTLQLQKIETDCRGVGVGPICYLFNNYLSAISTLTDREWGIFATLLLRKLFIKLNVMLCIES